VSEQQQGKPEPQQGESEQQWGGADKQQGALVEGIAQFLFSVGKTEEA
jgi:hypothetical protein